MSIAELFYAKQSAKQAHCARIFGFPRRQPTLPSRRRKPLLEPLEPRLLLATDPLLGSLNVAGLLTLQLTPDPDSVVVRHVSMNADGSEIVEVTSGAITERFGDTTGGIRAIYGDAQGGNDRIDLTGVSSPATLKGGVGDDTLIGGLGDDVLDGGSGNDLLVGGEGSDTFVARIGEGRDVLEGGPGIDRVDQTGTAGADRITVSATGTRLSLLQTVPVPGVLDLADIEQLRIDSRGGADTIVVGDLGGTGALAVEIDAGSGNDLVDTSAAAGATVTLLGGAGIDTLLGPARDATWTVTGADAGTVGQVTFSGIENLIGSAGNQDTFVVEQTGRISGSVDGGAGGFDSIVLDGGTYSSVVYQATGPTSGTIQRDADTITYDGMEPISDNTVANDRIIVVDNANHDDQVVVSNNAGSLHIASGNSLFESIDIASAPTGTLEIQADGGNDTFTVQGTLPATFNTKLKFTGGAGTDTVQTSQAADITLTNSQLAFGSVTIALDTIEQANLTNIGAIGHTLDASAFTAGSVTLTGGAGNDFLKGGSGNDTLTGGSGNDRYVFGPSWGTDTITSPDAGTDTLDFTGYSGTLTLNGTKTQITSSGNTVNQASPAERIDVALTAGLKAAITNGLTSLVSFADRVSTLQELANRLPLVTRELADAGLADLLDLHGVFGTFQTDAGAILGAATNLSDFFAGLQGLTFAPPSGIGVDVGLQNLTFDYRGATGDGSLELLIGLDLKAERKQDYKLDFGADADNYGISMPTPPNIRVQTDLTAGMTLGIATASPELFLADADLTLAVQGSATLASAFSANLGFLGVTIGPGNVSFSGSVGITVNDPNSDGRITTTELTTTALGTLLTVGPPTSSFSASLPVNVTSTGLDAATQAALAGANLALTLPGGANIFSGAIPSVAVTNGTANLLDFGNITAVEALSMLAQVKDTLSALAKSDFLDTEIPFTGKTVGDVLDFATVYKKKLDSLFASGDMLVPDNTGDGVPDLTFTNIQQMVGALALAVGASYNPSSKELKFHVDTNRLLSFGGAAVATPTPGNGSTNEVQRVTVSSDALFFRLGMADSQGVVSFTSELPVGISAADLEKALEALPSIKTGPTSDNVTVGRVGNVYTITFKNDQGHKDVPQLVSGIPLSFTKGLGDLASITTSSTIGLTANLTAGLDFGIDLDANSTVEITPPVFAPDTTAGVVVTLPQGATTNAVQILTVNNATFGNFTLTFGGETTANIAYNASGNDVQTKLRNLSTTTDDTLTVIKTTGGNDSIYTITLKGGDVAASTDPSHLVLPLDVDLKGASEGALSGDAHFKVNLFVNPATGVATVNDGATATNEKQEVTILNAASGTFKLAYNGNKSAAIAYNADASAVQSALEAPAVGIGAGNVSVTKNGSTYTIIFQGALAATNVNQLTTDISGLGGNPAPVSTITVTVARNTGNTSLTDLAQQTQTQVNTQLISSGITPGFLTTGLRTAGSMFTAGVAPFTALGGQAPNDLRFKVYDSAAADATPIATGRVLRVDAIAGLAGAIDTAIDKALQSAGRSERVTVGTDAGKLTITPTGGSLRIDFESPVKVDGGSSRISLSAPSVTTSYNALRPSAEVGRRIEIYADFDDTAYQEMGILSAPTRYDGKLIHFNGTAGHDVSFTLVVNGTDVPVSLLAASTSANTSIAQLITQLQAAVDSALTSSIFSAGDVEVYRVGQEIGAAGNRIGLRGKAVTVTNLSIEVPELGGNNGAIVHLGFVSGEGQTQRAKATEFFVDNVALSGSIVGSASIAANASFGFLGVNLTGTGTLSGSASLSLKDPVHGDSRITFNPQNPTSSEAIGVFNALSQGKFKFVAPGGGTIAIPATGPVAGSLSTNLDVDLTMTPSGALSGIAGASASATIDFHVPDWFTALPTPSDLIVNFTGPDMDAVFNKFTDLSFDNIMQGLQLVVQFLRSLDGSGPAGALIGALDFKLPLVNKSIADIIDIAGEYGDRINALLANPAGSLQELQGALVSRLNLPPGLGLSFDEATGVLKFDLGFDRNASLSQPFNLDLSSVIPSSLSFLNGLVGASASGDLNVTAGINLDLALGLDLLGSDAGTFFIFTGAGETGLTASASASGDNLGFSARLGPFNVSVIDGDAHLTGGISVEMVDTDGTNDGRLNLFDPDTGLTLPGLNAFSVNITGDGSATMPLFVGTEDNPIPIGAHNELEVVIESLANFITNPTDVDAVSPGDADYPNPTPMPAMLIRFPDFDLFTNPPALFDLLANPATLVGGLDQLLRVLQGALEGQILGVKLPFLGDVLDDNPAANFIGDLRDDILTPLAKFIRESNLDLFGLIDLVQSTLDDALNGIPGLDVSTITRSGYDGPAGPNPDTFVQYDFTIGNTIEISHEIAFDLGLPFLGLALDVDPTITITWSLEFGIGIDENLGFYFVTSNTDELSLSINVDLGSTVGSPATAQGRLGFLALTITDGVDLDGENGVEADEFSKLYLNGGVDIADPSGDGKLTFSEIVSGANSFGDIVKPHISGGADLLFHGVVNFGAISPSLATVLPAVSTDFVLLWDTSLAPGQPLRFDPPSIALSNITLDLGSFISDFAGPILGGIKEVLDPLEWLIGPDGLLLMRIPLISDLAGTTIQVKDLIWLFDAEHAPTVDALLDAVQVLYFLIDLVDNAGSNVGLNFGDLIITDPGSKFAAIGGTLFDKTLDLGISDVTSPGATALKDIDLSGYDLNNAFQPATEGSPSEATSTFTSGVTKEGSLSFDILKPANIFKLILGQPDVTLFTYELPEFGFDFYYRQEFPIWGPVVAFFGGGFGATFDFGFGYDTRGINQFLTTKDPANLINGFFLSDIDFATGYDRPEVTFTAEIAAGAGISLVFIKAGVEGGIGAEFDFNLSDLDNDGKVRAGELVANIAANSMNPLAVFDVSGMIDFFLRVFIEINLFITTIKMDFTIIDLTLFEFEFPFERPAILASATFDDSLGGNVVTLNIGPNAESRLKGDISDTNETIYAETLGAGQVAVWSDQFNVSKGVAELPTSEGFFRFSNVKKIVANGGAGDDVIDLTGVTDGAIVTEIHGGDGIDKIYGGAETDIFYGDGGNDELKGGGGTDTLYGGLGDDKLYGQDNNDTLFGQDGNDQLYGEGGADTLDGGKGDDTMDGGTGDGAADTYALLGAGSDDTITGGGASDVLDFTNFGQNVTFVFGDTAGTFFAGWGALTGDPLVRGSYEHTVSGLLSDITAAKGGLMDDVFHVFETSTSGLALDGQQGSDKYIIHGGTPPSSTVVMDASINDTGNPWDEDLIKVLGTPGDDDLTITNSSITFDLATDQTVTYTPPTASPIDSVMQIKAFGYGGNDDITIESTASTVAVRVEAGEGDDLLTVGGGTVDNILGTVLPNVGLGPVVLLGGAGHDTVVIDDSSDASNNVGNSTAFLEKRMGIAPLIEVGVVSGLDMKLTAIDDKGTEDTSDDESKVIDGRVEFEEFEVVDVQLGTGDDTFVIGGGFNLDKASPAGGTADTLIRVNTEFPKNRLAESLTDPTSNGIREIVNTISGMTMVEGGDGEDDIRILRTKALPDQQTEVSNRVIINPVGAGAQDGDRDATPAPKSEIAVIDIKADIGAFVLEFADQNLDPTDPSGDDTVPGAEQTVVLPYSIPVADGGDTTLAAQIKEALGALRLVGGTGFIDSVVKEAGPLPVGVLRRFTVTFSPQLDNLPNLRALDTKLLVAGQGNDDEISVQSIDQPTYILGGSVLQKESDPDADDDDQDILNVNVQIGINGPELASAPDGFNAIPPAKAVANGVNAQLTVDGGVEGDKYYVYLFGGTADSQINLFDSGGTTDDAAYIFGTEAADMFLLRAAVANDGLAFVAMIKPPQVPVLGTSDTHVERVNYRGSLDSMKIYSLGGDDAFGIDDTRLSMEIYGGEGEDFFQIGQLYKSQRNAAAGVPFADVFATIETTRGYLSNGISKDMKIFGGEDNDEFVVYHNLAPLALFGNDGDDSFLIRAFALVGSQEDLRERTDVSGDAGADLIQYAVNAPVNIDGGDGFDTVIVIGTEFNDDFVITEDGIFGAGLNIQFVRIEVVEVDGDAGDDRFFILGTHAGVLTKITGSLGSDTFFGNGPTPDVVSNDLLGHSGLISHTVDSTLPPDASEYSGIKVVGIAANVADDDEPAVRITVSDGTSIVSQVDPTVTDHYTVVLTRKPENKTKVIVTSRAPAGVKFTSASDGVVDPGPDGIFSTPDDGDSVAFTFDETNWSVPQTAYFTAYQTGDAEILVGNDGGNGENAKQTLAIQGTEGSFKLTSSDSDLGVPWTTAKISFDIRGDGKTTDGPDAGTLNREQELDQLALDIKNAINAVSSKTVTIQRVRTTFFIEFQGTSTGGTIDKLTLTDKSVTFNDIVGTADGFITHQVTLEVGAPEDSISNLFVQGTVAQQRDGKVYVTVDTEGHPDTGSGAANEIQILDFDASDGNFKIMLGDQVSEEMLFIPLDPMKVRDAIDNAINAFTGIDAVVTHIGAASDYSYQVEFNGASAGMNLPTLQVEASNLTKGERTLSIVGGLPTFIIAEGDDILRGATVKVVNGAGIGQVRLVIANTANTITVSNPWIEKLDQTSRVEILRYEGVVLPATLVQIVGDDGNAIDLRETGGDTVAFEAPQIHGFIDLNSDGIDDDNALAFVDTVNVSLTSKPNADVTVSLNAADSFGNPQLFFAIKEGAQFRKVSSLTFDDNDAATNAWKKAQTVYIFGDDDALKEGFHKAVLTLTASGGGYVDVVNSVVVDIADNEVPLAMVLESAHSTDVVETGNVFNGGVVPANDVDGDNAASDTYQIVLSKAPKAGETVKVNLSADRTRTQRGAGLLGIRAFDPEVNVNGLLTDTLEFDSVIDGTNDWFLPQTVTVTAKPDTKVEGDDSKSFAKRFDQANSMEGPLVITGGISEDRSADLEREPIYLPGETNFKPSIGTVQPVPAGVDGSFSLTIDLNEVIDGETVLDTRVEGGTQGILTVATNTNGDPGESIHEVQLLTVDAVSGTFRLTKNGTNFSADITYNPADPDAVATEIQARLNAVAGGTVTVEPAGTAFIITFADHNNHNPIQFADNANSLGKNNLARVGTKVDATNTAEQILTVFGNGGTFQLSLDGGSTKTAAIAFTPDDPSVNQAKVIEDKLNALLGAGNVGVSGSGTTYIVTFAVDPGEALGFYEEELRIDEVQTLTLNASLGNFKLSLDGGTNKTGQLSPGISAGDLATAIKTLPGVTGVAVTKDAEEPFYTIIFTGPGGENVNQLEVIDSTLQRTVKEALETKLDTTINVPEDLKDYTVEITRGDAKNKFRIVIGASDPDSSPAAQLTVLEIARPWEAGLTDQVPSYLPGHSEYTIEKTNPNLLVDENEETDFFFLNDTDNVTSISELPTAELIVTADHLSGLGMGGDQLIGGRLEVEGGIQYTGLEELIINLGPGDNRIIIEDTQPGATTINAGDGADQFFVHKVSGHTFLNSGAGADTINVSDGSMLTNTHLLSGINALLSVTGDVPQAVALTLGKGSEPDPVASVGGVDEIQQITVDATGGQFQAGFIVGGVRHFTDLLDYNVSETDLQDALQIVVQNAFGATDTTKDVSVSRGGNVYRITFTDQMGQRDVPLLEINDLGLTMETGAAPGDVLNIDNSADAADTQGVLTQTSLTGLGMGDLGTAGTTFNEIQTLRLDATGGTFTLGINGTTIVSGALDSNLTAVELDGVLEGMYLQYLNGLRLAADPEAVVLMPADAAGGLVEVARNDDVYVIRFVGLLSNADVAQLTVDGSALTRNDELPGGEVVTVGGLAETATRLDGITAEARNEVQRLAITATDGTFTVAFPNIEPENVTAALPYNVTRAQLQLALEALPAIVPGDVLITTIAGGFEVEFKGELSSTDLPAMSVNASALTGGTATVTTVHDGMETGLNDLQVMTVNATAGTFHLELYLPAIQKTLVTESLAFDASAEEVRRALQYELARKLNGLNADADLYRTREAFKSDFSVARVGSTYLIGFQGVTRQIDGGQGVSLLKVVGDADFSDSGAAEVLTRMDGINYYGFEEVNIDFGSGADILNVQGTSTGSFKGINAPLDTVHAATNITLAGGNDQIFISSNADLDSNTIKMTAGQADVFEFLTGDLDAISGNLNIDVGAGRHRLLVSDEAATAGDAGVTISGLIGTPTGSGGFDETGAAEIQVKELAFGDITYGAKGLANSNFYDGIIYWTGSGNDTIDIDGTQYRGVERTTTQLNTGLGDDYVTVDLDTGEDGFFVLHTMGGAAAHSPVAGDITVSDNDTVRAAESTLPLIVFGGLGSDDIIAGQNEDVVFGDFGRVQYLDGTGKLIAVFGFGGRDDMISSQIIDPTWVISRDMNLGGVDIIEGQGDDDVLVGGTGGTSTTTGDFIDGDTGDDLIFGDAVRLFRRDTNVAVVGGVAGSITNPRFESLLGQVIYDETGQVLIDGVWRNYRNANGDPVAAWNEYVIEELYHSQSIQDGDVAGLETSFGNDYIAGGANHDVIFGQLGDDTIQGDGAIASAVGAETVPVNRITIPQSDLVPVGAKREPDGTLTVHASFEAATDGDDYIEGNGGRDTIFGNLGQDDIIGDNSDLFTFDAYDERLPHGADMIFGGAGTDISRSNYGDATVDANGNLTNIDHGLDSDVILGDNGNIFRLVGVNRHEGVTGTSVKMISGFLAFNYDNYPTGRAIISRAAQLLDYTPGGMDYDPDNASNDIGTADEIHGESGDDFLYGMVGEDVLFGEGQDDDLIGGYGNDWISGGTGDDGVLGDDGRIYTSRNSLSADSTVSLGEPLYGIAPLETRDPDTRFSNGNVLNEFIYTPGKIQQSTINMSGKLKKTVNLEPFSVEATWNAMADEFNGVSRHHNDDIIYGGLGNDFLHGGSGDDAISGAESLPYGNITSDPNNGTIYPSYDKPSNPGDILAYNPTTTVFSQYYEYTPLEGINGFLLNFNETEGVTAGTGTVGSLTNVQIFGDGEDEIFGDLGNDWIVGGTGRDHLYGGWGDDLLNADDNLTTNGALNNLPDTAPSYEDIAYGGAGRDVLIANTGGDRLIDWVGEFNSYLVPYAPFGMATVSRTLQPQLPEYLYALSAGDGADPTRAADVGGAAEPIRNGEPWGELGVVIQKDFTWQDQTGAPRDVQAGNIPGGKRDVLRSASFNGVNSANALDGFAVDSGSWKVANGTLQVSAESLGNDAAAVFYVDQALPGYYEVLASISAVKPTSGWKANSYIIFDYYSPTDFKFAGLDVSLNRFVMGHRNTQGWILDAFTPTQVKPGIYYNLLLAVNGTTATLSLDDTKLFSYAFAPRVVDGYSYNLNTGMVGVGSDNSRGVFDNITVQQLAPQITFQDTEEFTSGTGLLAPTSGSWQLSSGRYVATPLGSDRAVSLVNLQGLSANSFLGFEVTLNTKATGGFVYDYYSADDFKYVAIDAMTNQVILGHHTGKGWSTDAVASKTIGAGVDHKLAVSLKGTTVSVTLDGQAVTGYVYNAITIDGKFGLLTVKGSSSFDVVTFRTDDPGFLTTGAPLLASAAATLTSEDLSPDAFSPIRDEAISRWSSTLDSTQNELLRDVRFLITDLPGLTLGQTSGYTILIDSDAAGNGWFIDPTPSDGREFLAVSNTVGGRMDLLTVVTHELGHVIGYADLDPATHRGHLMSATLDVGTRRLSEEMGASQAPGTMETLGSLSPNLAASPTATAGAATNRAATSSLTLEVLSLPLAWNPVSGSLTSLDSPEPLAGITSFLPAADAVGGGNGTSRAAKGSQLINWTPEYAASAASVRWLDAKTGKSDPGKSPVEVEIDWALDLPVAREGSEEEDLIPG